MSGAPEVYFDTNAWSDLFRRKDLAGEERLRRELVNSALAARYRYVTSGWAIEEIGGIAKSNWSKYRQVVTFILGLVGGGLILQTGDLVDRELRAGRRLRGDERFFSKQEIADWHEVTQQPKAVRDSYEELHDRKRASVIDGRGRRESVRAKLEDVIRADPNATARDASAATLEWHANGRQWIEAWSRDALKDRLRRLGRDPAEAATYPLERVPTITNVVAQMLARVAWYVGHSRRIDQGDDPDTHHYAAACYADLFVCSDDGLAHVIALIPDPHARPITFEDFVCGHLRPHTGEARSAR